MHPAHPLDRSLAITPAGRNVWHSPSSPLYWNSIGPFGGWLAAMLLHAVLSEDEARGDPVSLQAQFIGSLRQAPFSIHTRRLRQGRSTAFWQSEIRQAPEDGGDAQVCAHATVTLAGWRETFTLTDAVMPPVPPATTSPQVPPRPFGAPAFLARYDFRMASGPMFQSAPDMNSLLWVRDAEPRRYDARSIAAICDAPFPSIWLRLDHPVLITTVAYNVFFRTGAAGLASAGDGHVLLQSRCASGSDGFFDQDTLVWSETGALLAQTQQLAWFSNKPLARP